MREPVYTIVRNCCTSGNCFTCRDATPLGKPLRVVHAYGLREEVAKRMLDGWRRYAPEMRVSRQEDWEV